MGDDLSEDMDLLSSEEMLGVGEGDPEYSEVSEAEDSEGEEWSIRVPSRGRLQGAVLMDWRGLGK